MNKSSAERLFVSINLPDHITEAVYHKGKDYFSNHRAIKQIPQKNVHITLKFLGDVQADRIDEVEQTIASSLAGIKTFNIELDNKIDAFPAINKAGIIFIGVRQGAEDMEKIFTGLERNLDDLGFKPEKRKFVPHATIARIKKRMDIGKIAERLNFEQFPIFKCDKIMLMESELKTTGAEYRIKREFGLKDF
ncbi:MAG: RNA 2',3'-cyclic phosphodiesterase [Actinomycetota bacterium]|nr:RNA 2',3'-cyclic phosphodiesterase [Actinomycetota bacterium]